MTNRAKAVSAIANECAEAGDREGQLAAPVVDAFHREGLLGMWVPRSLKGGLYTWSRIAKVRSTRRK